LFASSGLRFTDGFRGELRTSQVLRAEVQRAVLLVSKQVVRKQHAGRDPLLLEDGAAWITETVSTWGLCTPPAAARRAVR
jgi:hypothetical protein